MQFRLLLIASVSLLVIITVERIELMFCMAAVTSEFLKKRFDIREEWCNFVYLRGVEIFLGSGT